MPVVVYSYPAVAGAISAVGSVLLDVEFERAIIIAAITGMIAGVGTVVGAIMAARYAKRASDPIKEDVTHVKRALEVNRRREDQAQEQAVDAVERTRHNGGD